GRPVPLAGCPGRAVGRGRLAPRLSGGLAPGLRPGLSRRAGRPGRGAKFLSRPVVLRIAAWRLMRVVHGTERAAQGWDVGQQILGAAWERRENYASAAGCSRMA